jgi:all-trans-retinol 13,14-reductase
MKKCIIIGSGLGGLSTGVILAKNGYEVTILEQASQVGGCLQCFTRDGVKFETGMHFIGSLDDDQVLSHYLNYLEIKDKITFNRLDTQAYDVVALQGERFDFPNGREAFIEKFAQRFPSQRENLERYCDLVEQVASLSPFRDLQHNVDENRFIDDKLLYQSLSEVIDQTITDPLLRVVLVGNLSLYAAQKDKTPFATHAFIFDFYNKSAFRIVGGSDAIVKALRQVLEQYGGTILTRHKVSRILVEGKKATGVVTENGKTFIADVVISDVNPKQLVDLVEPSIFTEAYKSRIKGIPDTISVFSLFLRFKEGAMPYINSNFYGFHTDSPWKMSGTIDDTWPQGYLYMHHCHEPNPKTARGGVVLAYMSMDAVKQWSETTIGRRGKEYEQFKHEMAERLIDAVEQDFPSFRESLADYYAATPLTYRDYTLTPNGSIYGLARNVNNIADRVSFKTKVSNLFLVGQNINSHGMLGVLVGTMTVCQHLLGEEKVRQQMVEANRKTVVVIGGGLGGLVSGALLAKEGYKVTVLEKNAIIGGGLQNFKRHCVNFPTGMHVFGGFNEVGQLHKLFSYLGIMDRLSIRAMDEDGYDVVKVLEDSTSYILPQGKERYINYLSQVFPAEKDNIRAYVEKMYALSEEEDLFYLRERPSQMFMTVSEYAILPYDELIGRYISDSKLKGLLTYNSPLFGGVAGTTPAFMAALLGVLHIGGTYQFVGGSQQMANLLKSVIEEAGGQVISNEEVVRIKVENHEVKQVITRKGHIYCANGYISDVHPDVLLRLVDDKAFPVSFKKRLQLIPESYSSFKVYVKFKEKAFPYLNCTNYCLSRYDSQVNFKSLKQEEWPNNLMYYTPAVENQGEYAETMIIISEMDFQWVKPWEDTKSGQRGETYEKWKLEMTEQVLDFMEKLYPDFRDKIDFIMASSPLTIRDYYGNKEGSNYGFQKDSHNIMLSQMSVFTKVKNLFLTGQNVNIHGLCGVSITAIQTAEAFVGLNAIVRKINKTR